MSAALHAAHLSTVFRARTVLPNALSAAQYVVRSISNSIVQRSDYEHVNKVLTGEAHEPYPRAKPNSSLFEDDTDEYAAFVPISSPSTDDNATALNTVLHMHLRDKKMDRALSLLDEFDTAGVPVHEDAEFKLIEEDDFRPEDARAFIKLWSHVPHYKQDTHDRDYQADRFLRVLRPFFMRGTDLVPMVNFALLAATKGYAHVVGEPVVSHLVRYATPEYAEVFVEQLLETARNHQNNNHEYERMRRWWYNLLIRGQTINLRIDYVVQLLLRARNQLGIRIVDTSYELLLRELYRFEREDLLHEIKALANEDYPLHSWNYGEHTDLDPLERDPDDRLHNKILDLSDEDAAVAVRDILDTPPNISPHYIANFIEDCMERERQPVIDLIDSWANQSHETAMHRRPRYWSGRWSAAVMLYFFRRAEYNMVLNNFVHRFQVYGLPIDELFVNRLLVQQQGPLKLWPSAFAQAIAVQAMIYSTPAHASGALRVHTELYEKWLMLCKQSVPTNVTPSDQLEHVTRLETGGDVEGAADQPLDLMDATFTPAPPFGLPPHRVWQAFISWALRNDLQHGRQFMVRVLHDMHDMGVVPGVIIWTRILIELVQQRYYRLALYFMDRMEERQASISDFDWPGKYSILHHFEHNLPRPTVIMYGALLHVCMKTAVNHRSVANENLEVAHNIRRRMMWLGWGNSDSGGMQRTLAMFRDLDDITNWNGRRELFGQQRLRILNNLQRYQYLKKDEVEYDFNPNFPPRSGKLNSKEPYLKRLWKPKSQPPMDNEVLGTPASSQPNLT
ncbi:hypothetical protein CALVIDRAFT_227291 [Calocera viscosa TUFC12733]|uniref:Uncharacterized protein n=1 Tax=Calocera viscosa (strain TUFC12733) TaxID=1330018 RepID=A0A167K2I7_CALVF|nr:hypothetical protein CALVIDRAFT_227291 [Calocera viscosa TUFC12733]